MDSYRYRRKGSLSIQQVLYFWESDREREKKRRFHIVIFFFLSKINLIEFISYPFAQ
ncbi:unnamed protein product [Arabidopsis halleri]